MSKVKDCIAKVTASHNLNEKDVDAILAVVDDGGSTMEGVDAAERALVDYRRSLVSQLEESYPELTGPVEKPSEPERPVPDSQVKKAQSRIYNASLRDLAANQDMQQFASLNSESEFPDVAVEHVSAYLQDRRDKAAKDNARDEKSALESMLGDDNKANSSVFNSEYYGKLWKRARRRAEEAQKEKKMQEFLAAAEAKLKETDFSNMKLAEVKSYIRGYRWALNKKSKSTLKDQSPYANSGFAAARDLMAEYKIGGAKRKKFEGTGGRLRRLHEMVEKESDGEKTDQQFVDAILRIADRSSLLSHDVIHPDAAPGMHRLLDWFRDNVRTFKKVYGAEKGGGTRSWSSSYSEAILQAAGEEGGRKAMSDAANEYVKSLNYIASLFERNKDGNIEDFFKILREEKIFYEITKATDDEVASQPYKYRISRYKYTPSSRLKLGGEFDGLFDYYGVYGKDILSGNIDTKVQSLISEIDGQNAPYIPPTRTKPLRRKRLDHVTRVGFQLHRDGKNVTAEQMRKDLGFREVFAGINGNVQEHMNYAYDALMDLAELVGTAPKNIAFGEMWFGIGALGQGGKTAAHFSPNWPLPENEGDIPEGYNPGDKIPHMHLTATSGDGTVAHEWTHALDHFLGKLDKENGRALVNALYKAVKYHYVGMTEVEAYVQGAYERPESYWRIKDTEEAKLKYPGDTDVDKRARKAYSLLQLMKTEEGRQQVDYHVDLQRRTDFLYEAEKLDDKQQKPYWSTQKELIARLGEAYYYDLITNDDRRSDYLVNEWASDDGVSVAAGYRGRPYPTGDERKTLNNIFESFLNSIDWSSGEPRVIADWTPDKGLADKQGMLDAVDELTAKFDVWEKERRVETLAKEEEMRKKEEEALKNKRDSDLGELEELAGELSQPEAGPTDAEIEAVDDEVAAEEDTKTVFDMSDDEIDDMLDEAEVLAEESSQEDHTEDDLKDRSGPTAADEESVAGLLAQAGNEAGEGLKEALDGLADLFGEKGRLNSFPPGFSPEGYNKAKPHFINAIGSFVRSGKTVKQAAILLFKTWGKGIRMYLEYFLKNDYAQMQRHKRSFAMYLYNQMLSGNYVVDNPGLKRMLALQKGKPVADITPMEMKSAQESVELATVMMARHIAQSDRSQEQKFVELRELYQKMPNLNIQTTTSSALQQYSTPIPLAYLASVSAIANEGAVYEPTAGNGALLINTSPENARVNELNEERVHNMQGIGFTVDTRDALDYVEQQHLKRRSMDVVLANPPFGALDEDRREDIAERFDGYKIEKIDQAIVAESLRSLKDDGKATIIIGANKIAGEISGQDRTFFNWLYSNYQVEKHFEVDGSLYSRQGASWPVRFITISGRREEVDDAAVSPAPGDIRRLYKWEDIYAEVTGQSLPDGMEPQIGKPTSTAGDGGRDTGMDGTPEDNAGNVPEPATGEAGEAGGGEPTGGAGVGAGTGPRGGRGGEPGGDSGTGVGLPADAGDQLAGGTESPAGEGLGADNGARGTDVQSDGKRAGKRLDDFQAEYTSFSEGEADPDLRVPANMRQAIFDSLTALTNEVGPVDEYLLKKLNYDSKDQLFSALAPHQIDAVALAIYQIERGKALIIGDQTGVGKGRQAAAVMRYAKLQGKIPLFFTAKKDLYTDMHRDLQGIGEEHNPYITDTGGSVQVEEQDAAGNTTTKELFKTKPADNKRVVEHMSLNGALPKGYDMVFTTYSQISSAAYTDRRNALRAIAPNSIIIMDESHKASGESGTGEFLTELLSAAQGATYLSATYSKRPETMPIYFKTDMFDAVDSNDDLINAMTAGGEPLQQAVSYMLAKSGQLITRQRTFEGIRMDTKVVGQPIANEEVSEDEIVEAANQEANSDAATKVLRAIHKADVVFADQGVSAIQSKLQREGGGAAYGGSNASKITVSHSPFASAIFNLNRQFLFATKVNAVAEQAIAAHKRGEKPIIAVSNTMETMYNEYAKQLGIGDGDDISNMSYADVLKRALNKVPVVTLTDKKGNKMKQKVEIGEMPAQVQAAFFMAEQAIDSLPESVTDTMPTSPIDFLTHRLEQEGVTVGELTGRQNKLEYGENGKITFKKRTKDERNGVLVAKEFNDNKNRAIILNISGSTGISLHSAKEFGDHGVRHLIVAQPELDINIYIQILGRINRFRQLKRPIYTTMTTNIPSELRLLSMLYAKLKKLNANVSSDTKSNTQIEAPDILNKYGEEVVDNWLKENLNNMGEYAGLLDGLAGASKVTGRIAMLPVEEQRLFYDDVVPAYESLIEELTARGENDLITETIDYDAIELDSEVIKEGKDPRSEFGKDSVWGMYSVKRQGKPPTPGEVGARVLQKLTLEDGSKISPDEYPNKFVSEIMEEMQPKLDAAKSEIQSLQEQFDAAVEAIPEEKRKQGLINIWDIDEKTKENLREMNHRRKILQAAVTRIQNEETELKRELANLGFGKVVRFRDSEDQWQRGVIVDYKALIQTPSIRTSPLAMSRIKLTVMIPDGRRELPFKLSEFIGEKFEARRDRWSDIKSVFETNENTESRERQQIITGNLIAALTESEVAKRGRIINFTHDNGSEDIGIKLSKTFNRGAMLSGNYPMRSAEDIWDFIQEQAYDSNLKATGIRSTQNVLIYPESEMGRKGIKIYVPGAKNAQKSYWGNEKLTQYTGDFVDDGSFSKGSKRKAAVIYDRDKGVAAIRELQKRAAFFVMKSVSQKAKKFVDSRKPDDDGPDGGGEGGGGTYERRGGPVANPITTEKAQGVLNSLNLNPEIADKITLSTEPSPSKGLYVSGKGVVIYLSNIGSEESLLRTLRHEIIGHWGIRSMLSPTELQDVLMRVRMASNTDTRVRAIAAEVRQRYPDVGEDVLAEEIIARVAEDGVKNDFIDRIIMMIRNVLRKAGLIKNDISVEEINELLAKSGKYMQQDGAMEEAAEPQEREARYDNEEQERMARKVGSIIDDRTLPKKLSDWWNDFSDNLWKKVEQQVFDRYSPLRDFDLHSWKLARMSHTASGVIEHLFKYGRIDVTPDGGITTRDENQLGQSLGEILAPLGEEVDRFFNWMISNRAEGLAEEGRENWLTPDEIRAGKTMNEGTTESGENREELYENIRRQFVALHEHVVDTADRLGVINSDERETWNNDFYIPFYRVLEGDTESQGPKMLDGLTNQDAYKRLRGAERQIGDPVSNVLMNWHHLVSAGLKNQAAKSVVDKGVELGVMKKVHENAKTKDAFYIREPVEVPVRDDNGEIVEDAGGNPVMREVRGAKQWYESTDRLVTDAITALNMSALQVPGIRMMGSFKRFFTMGVTMNPEFMIANLIRDSIHSSAVTQIKKNPIANILQGIGATKNDSEIERRMLAGGGALHFGLMYADDPEGAKRLIRDHIEEDSIITTAAGRKKFTQAIKGAKNKWMEVGSRFENINRAALYEQLKADKVSDFEANFQARDLLDFSQGGANSLVRFLTQAVPFLNARLQGMHKLVRAWEDPQQRGQFIAVLGAYVAASMALFLAYKDDDDYKQREEWDRDAYHWFKVGDTAFRIPRPFEIGTIATVAERTWDLAFEEEGTPKVFGERMLHALTQTFEIDPVPQMFRPVLNIATDTDPFTKRRIEGEHLRDLPPEARRRLYTSEAAIMLSKGMSNVLWDGVTLSPVQIEHLVEGYAGWIGATALSTADMFARGIMDDPSRPAARLPSDLWIIGRFARAIPEPHNKYTTRFYEQNDKIKKLYNHIRQAQKERNVELAKQLYGEYKDDIKWKNAYGKVERQLSKVNAEILRIRMRQDISREEKRRRIDDLTNKKNQLTEKLVKKRGY